jgi:tripartite-type tricarboxylate transporter receptor subunit TctC
MIAQHMADHIPGNPTIIVKNMPSESGINATNYVGLQAKKDGLTAVCGPYGPAFQIFQNPNLKVDLTKFDVITGDGDGEVMYIRADVPPGMKSGQDIFNANPASLKYGGIAYNAQKDTKARAFFDLIGLKGYTYVTGFTGDSAGRAAIQQNFLNLYSEAMTGYHNVTEGAIVKPGLVIPVVQTGTTGADGKRIRDPRVPDVPTYGEFYEQHFGKPPSGPDWEVMQAIVSLENVAAHWFALPPDSPPEAVAIMRKAAQELNSDPEFLAESEKLRGPGVTQWPGEVVAKNIDNYLHLPPDVLKTYFALVDAGKQMLEPK